jgi:cell fate regulator YaaT (PSP1 superfamily)
MNPATVGVRFRRAGKIYYFRAEGLEDLSPQEHVVVDTSRGRELGWVVIAPGQMLSGGPQDLKPVARRATSDDLAGLAERRSREPDALASAHRLIAAQDLPMKAVLAEYSFDGSQLTIYFISDETRVDFRALVRELARELRTRVHLRQIGPRDRAKLVGGIDRCGRELCCTSWMTDFQPISIRMAKTQNLPLSPSEISGVCGKLLCCLAFEDEQYTEMRQGMPKLGAKLTSAVGKGKVVDVNLLTRRITIAWETGGRVEVGAEEFAEQQERRKRAIENGQELPAD